MLKFKVNNVCVGIFVKYVLLFQVCPKEDGIRQGDSASGHSVRMGNFIQRHINFESANERDGNTETETIPIGVS